ADWIADQPALRAILATADRVEPDLDFPALEQGLEQRRLTWPTNTEAGRAALIWQLLQQIAETDRTTPGDHPPYVFAFGSNIADATREFVERLISPLFDYFTEQVGQDS